MSATLAELLDSPELTTEARDVRVLVSYDVVKLFSEQLYTTPVKAIEELVVNSWDAEATDCSVLVDSDGDLPVVAVFDTGKGMSIDELENLWHIGISSKTEVRSKRRQIGKFGIGKLASYAVARRATYVSKTDAGIYSVAIDFEDFAQATDATGTPSPVTLTIRRLNALDEFISKLQDDGVDRVLNVQSADGSEVVFDLAALPSWTLVILEDLKPKAAQLRRGGRLRWVLETAMPFASDFRLYLNAEPVESSKRQLATIASMNLRELDDRRLRELSQETGEEWVRTDEGLSSPSFPSGISGEAYVTEKSLYSEGGKSEDLGRSHGFFVRVHNRLINETDPLFGARPLSYGTFYRFAAVVNADDLNDYVTAARDDVEQSDMKAKLRALLIAVFYQARDLAEVAADKKLKDARINKEGQLDYVSTALVEKPLADALAEAAEQAIKPASDGAAEPMKGAPTANSWRYLEPVEDLDAVRSLVEQLYSDRRVDKRYSFRYTATGSDGPLVRLDAESSTFSLNEDHEFVIEFGEDPVSRRALETVAASEVMLEVYLRETRIEPEVIQHVLDRRDLLLRSLARDEGLSLKGLAQELRDSRNDAVALEIATVGALRALGFAAEHVGGPGTPDGVASYLLHGTGRSAFTLEAKSSDDQPSLGHLDFAGLRSHYEHNDAQGCLLVAPQYPGGLDKESEVSRRARLEKVSCWTIDQLAAVVEAAESRHINASELQAIIFNAHDPASVTEGVSELLGSPDFSQRQLYRAIIAALRDLAPRLRDATRDVSMISAEVSRDAAFHGVDYNDVQKAIGDLARASRGMLNLSTDGTVQILGDLDELARRVISLTGDDVIPRRRGSFRGNGD